MNVKIFGAICFVIILVAGISVHVLSPKTARTIKPRDEHNPFRYEKYGNLTINTTIPNESASMKIYSLTVPDFNLKYCTNLINETYPGWLSDDVKINEIDVDEDGSGIDVISFVKENESIDVYKSGAFHYFNDSALPKWMNYCEDFVKNYTKSEANNESIYQNTSANSNNESLPGNGRDSKNLNETNNNDTQKNGTESLNQIKSNSTSQNSTTENATKTNKNTILIEPDGQISRDKAYNVSIEYIKNHKGFPKEEYYLGENYSSFRGIPHLNIEILVEYHFIFRRKIDSFPVMGGDGIHIALTPFGDVDYYRVLWRQISKAEKSVTTVNATAAIAYLDNKANFRMGPGKLTIEKIELGYYGFFSDDVQKKLAPVWIFWCNCDSEDNNYVNYICVDTVELKIYY